VEPAPGRTEAIPAGAVGAPILPPEVLAECLERAKERIEIAHLQRLTRDIAVVTGA
jgi:hypothetical protein